MDPYCQMTPNMDNPKDFERIHRLPNHRQLHYASCGNPVSSTVIIFFAGPFSVGTACDASLPESLKSPIVHFIAPTLPGNGQSSSTPKGVCYHVNLCNTITSLLEELHPTDHRCEKLYLSGGSYGTVQAQMLYGASFDLFPLGRHIRGLLLAAPFFPFHYQKDYAKTLTWSNWIAVGSPSQWVPFRLIPRILSWGLARKMADLKGAGAMMDMALFDKMDVDEKARFERFAREQRGISGEDLKIQMSEGALRCVRGSWEGFLEGADLLHSEWGFEPKKLDKEHSDAAKPVLVVISEADDLGDGMARWIVENYGFARLKKVEGGHAAALYHLNEIWAELLEISEAGIDH